MKKLILVSSLVVGSFAQNPYVYGNQIITTKTQAHIHRNKHIPPKTITQVHRAPTTISQTPGLVNRSIVKIEANGIGVAPSSSISPAQSTAMARRAAIIDGYKALTEKIYGIKVNGRETVKEMVLQNSTLRTRIAGIIRGATIEDETYKNGMYKVVMSLKLNLARWNHYLRHNPPYYYNY